MDFGDDKFVAARRIKYAEADGEAGDTRPRLQRRQSMASEISISSVRSNMSRTRRASIDPANAMPIEYRTLSYQIEDSKSKGKDIAEVKKAKDKAAAELSELDWHTISTQSLFTRLSTDLDLGLSTDQVKRRVAEYGRNVPSKPPSGLFGKLMGYCFGGFGSLLLIGSVLVFLAWKPLGQPPAPANLALAIVLFVVFLAQAAFNGWQDWSSSRVMASITTMLPDSCLVIRDGAATEIMATELVPGDVLRFKSGNKLPADVRFVEVSSDVKLDRSILTGESVAIGGAVDSTDDNYLETQCIGLQGTHCISGSGLGVVVAIGDRTVFGRIAKLTSTPHTSMTPLQKEILRFVILISSFALSMIVLVIILWAAWIRHAHPSWITVPLLIVDCVSVAIAFIPEGLPIALTAGLTITANMMRKNKILCKSLRTVESLGSVSVICSDKTGTLTKNQMFVTDCAVKSTAMRPESARDEMVKQFAASKPNADNAITQLRAVAGLCNAGEFDATTVNAPLHERKINGDATDQAVLRFSESIGSVADLRRFWRKDFELAFNSKNKFMIRLISLVEAEGLNIVLSNSDLENFNQETDKVMLIKGAPDVLIGRCNTVINEDGAVETLDEKTLSNIEKVKDSWSSEGKRVILLARKVVKGKGIKSSPTSNEFEREMMEQATSGLTLVGLVGIVDPPRDEIPFVIDTLRRAGIRIFMVTGDFKLTAHAIARECGIISNPPESVHDISALARDKPVPKKRKDDEYDGIDPNPDLPQTSIVLSGPELLTLNESQWEQLVRYHEIVFARTTPEQKLRIVRELQAREFITAMTGDGVNDAPSLKAADVGIALGSGSDIAIEAADMVLLDSFSAVVEAVQFGRVVFDNLRKTITYLLPAGTYSEFWPVMTNVVLGLPQVLSSFLMIVICCLTDCVAATTLAYEKPEADVLRRKPRNLKKDKLVDWRLFLQGYFFIGTIECLTSFAMAYWYLQRQGVPFSAMWLKFGELPPGLDPDYVAAKQNEASSIYFINLVVMQWFNLMAVRTRRLSIFQQPPAFNKATQNLRMFPAILFALLIAFFFCYVPSVQKTLLTTNIPVEHFFLPVAFGIVVLFLDEVRKYFVRKYPNGLLAKAAW